MYGDRLNKTELSEDTLQTSDWNGDGCARKQISAGDRDFGEAAMCSRNGDVGSSDSLTDGLSHQCTTNLVADTFE